MRAISNISVVLNLQELKRNYRADPYSAHPKKVKGIESIFRIAEYNQWKIEELNKLVTEPLFKSSGTERNVDGPIIAVKPGALTDDFLVDFSKCARETEEEYNKAGKRQLQDGDIVLLADAHAEGYIGYKTSIIRLEPGQRALLLGHLIKVRPDKTKINPYFLLAYLNSEPARNFLNYSVRGQTVGLHAKDAGKLPVLLPPREIQDSIGNKLKEAIEAKIEAGRKKEEVKQAYTKVLPSDEDLDRYSKEITTIIRTQETKTAKRIDPQYFSKYVEGILTKLKTTDNFYLEKRKFFRGKTPSEKEYTNSGIFVIKVRDVLPDGRVNLKGAKSYIDESNFEKNYKKYAVHNGDILFVATGKGSIGRVGLLYGMSIKAIASGELLVYREMDETKRWIILGLFLQQPLQSILDKISLGPSGQTHLYPDQIVRIPIPLLEPSKRECIITCLKEYLRLMNLSEQLHSQAMEELNRLLGLKSEGDES